MFACPETVQELSTNNSFRLSILFSLLISIFLFFRRQPRVQVTTRLSSLQITWPTLFWRRPQPREKKSNSKSLEVQICVLIKFNYSRIFKFNKKLFALIPSESVFVTKSTKNSSLVLVQILMFSSFRTKIPKQCQTQTSPTRPTLTPEQ